MAQYKVIASVSWKIDSPDCPQQILDRAKRQLEAILDCSPSGEQFDGFTVQMDLAPMKERSKLQHLAEYDPDTVFDHITLHESRRAYVVDGVEYLVKMNSQRYHVFKDGRHCCVCGLEGTKMVLDMNPGDCSPHFNLYGEEHGRMVLMTKDHRLPKSKGGTDTFDNYACMCTICNNLKGNMLLSYDQILRLRIMYNNHDKLPRRELREAITRLRNSFEECLVVGGDDDARPLFEDEGRVVSVVDRNLPHVRRG